jgi:hypothetical protein
MDAGKGAVAALEATGLSHAQADLAWYGDKRNPNHVTPGSVKLPPVPEKGDDGYEVALRMQGLVVAELRAGAHAKFPEEKLSWGQIAVVCGTTESHVRRAFTATGLDSKGTRKGRGGRWLSDEPRYYVGNRKGIGVEDAQPKRLNPVEVARTAADAQSVLPKRIATLKQQVSGNVAKATRARKGTAKRTPTKK